MINKIKNIYTLFSNYGFPIFIALLLMKLYRSSTGTITKDVFYQTLIYTFIVTFGIILGVTLRKYVDKIKK